MQVIEITGSEASFYPDYIQAMERQRKCLSPGLGPVSRRRNGITRTNSMREKPAFNTDDLVRYRE